MNTNPETNFSAANSPATNNSEAYRSPAMPYSISDSVKKRPKTTLSFIQAIEAAKAGHVVRYSATCGMQSVVRTGLNDVMLEGTQVSLEARQMANEAPIQRVEAVICSIDGVFLYDVEDIETYAQTYNKPFDPFDYGNPELPRWKGVYILGYYTPAINEILEDRWQIVDYGWRTNTAPFRILDTCPKLLREQIEKQFPADDDDDDIEGD